MATPSSSSLNELNPYAKRNLYAGQFIIVDHNNWQLPNDFCNFGCVGIITIEVI